MSCKNGEVCGCGTGGCCPCACHEARSREIHAARAVAKQECRCLGIIIPGGPCRHQIASTLLRRIDAQAAELAELASEADAAAFFLEVNVVAGRIVATLPRADGRAPLHLAMKPDDVRFLVDALEGALKAAG